MGQNPYIGLPANVYILISGVALAGLGGSWCNNNGVPAIIKVLEYKYRSQKEILYNMASGVYNAGFALGEVIGPIAGSLMVGAVGFKNGYAILSGVFAIYLLPLAFVFFCYKGKSSPKRRIVLEA